MQGLKALSLLSDVQLSLFLSGLEPSTRNKMLKRLCLSWIRDDGSRARDRLVVERTQRLGLVLLREYPFYGAFILTILRLSQGLAENIDWTGIQVEDWELMNLLENRRSKQLPLYPNRDWHTPYL